MAPRTRRRCDALLLAPGAGSDRNHPTAVAIEEQVAPLPVRRMDFPYRKAGRRSPDRPPVLLQAVRDEAAALVAAAAIRAGRLGLGGRSMGGRMCSMAVADGLPASALVLLSYPLHPPGRPDQLRVEHLPRLQVPCLFVSGTRDPFGTPEELEHHAGAIPGPVTFVWVDGAGHEWRRRDASIAEVVVAWIAGRAVPDRLPR